MRRRDIVDLDSVPFPFGFHDHEVVLRDSVAKLVLSGCFARSAMESRSGVAWQRRKSLMSQGERGMFDRAELERAKIVMFGEAEELNSDKVERRTVMLLNPARRRDLMALWESLGPSTNVGLRSSTVELMVAVMAMMARKAAAAK